MPYKKSPCTAVLSVHPLVYNINWRDVLFCALFFMIVIEPHCCQSSRLRVLYSKQSIRSTLMRLTIILLWFIRRLCSSFTLIYLLKFFPTVEKFYFLQLRVNLDNLPLVVLLKPITQSQRYTQSDNILLPGASDVTLTDMSSNSRFFHFLLHHDSRNFMGSSVCFVVDTFASQKKSSKTLSMVRKVGKQNFPSRLVNVRLSVRFLDDQDIG